jgi:hypothetical protein
MDARDISPFRMSKPFDERMPEVLEALESDPDGLFQVTYRVGPIMVSAQIWRDPASNEVRPVEFSESDREFLSQVRVLVDDSTQEMAKF